MVPPFGTLAPAACRARFERRAPPPPINAGVAAALNSATIPIRDIGGGRITVTAQAITATATTTAVRLTSKTYGADLTATISAGAARTLGTATPDQLLVQATEAINLIPTIRIFQNSRDTGSRGQIVPIDWGAKAPFSGLIADVLADSARQRLYIANRAEPHREVFDMVKRVLLAPIPAGQLPRSMAFGRDINTLYVCGSPTQAAKISRIVDLNKGAVSGRVRFPPSRSTRHSASSPPM